MDVLGYVVFPTGYTRVRRRNVTRFRRRLTRLEAGHARAEIPLAHARQSIASWLGLARHASAFRLSRGLLLEPDVRNIGKRLLLVVRCGMSFESASVAFPDGGRRAPRGRRSRRARMDGQARPIVH